MTLAEFKAWFEGFTEAIEGAPTEKQWARIKEQIEKIAPPAPVFIPPTTERFNDDWMKKYTFGPATSLADVSARLRAEADQLSQDDLN